MIFQLKLSLHQFNKTKVQGNLTELYNPAQRAYKSLKADNTLL